MFFADLKQVTRDAFAFARDKGLPFSDWIGAVHPRKRVPINATIVSTVISALLALIYIGSPLAFYAITSVSLTSLSLHNIVGLIRNIAAHNSTAAMLLFFNRVYVMAENLSSGNASTCEILIGQVRNPL